MIPGEWSAGPAVPGGPDVAELIAEQARSRPDAVAVTCEGARLTYRQLNGRANQLARYLREAGVRPEVPVGVCLERDPHQLVCLLGVLRSGGAYVPLDPGAPAERIRHAVADTAMPLLLTRQRLQPALDGAGTAVVSLDRPAPRSPGTARATCPARPRRASSRTSSTPPAPPGGPRAWRWNAA